MGFNETTTVIVMGKFDISVSANDEVFNFQVVNKGTDRCEYEVYSGEILVAVFEPDENEYIHICRTPAA
jgi:hypothetical protein